VKPRGVDDERVELEVDDEVTEGFEVKTATTTKAF